MEFIDTTLIFRESATTLIALRNPKTAGKENKTAVEEANLSFIVYLCLFNF